MAKQRILEKLSVVIPCKDEEKNLNELYNSICQLNIPSLELILIDDGSVDNTWSEINQISQSSQFDVIGLKFTKNFGKEAALEAGLSHCTGNVVITMDADLQHPVNKIPELIRLWENNTDVYIINTVKANRQKESFIKGFFVALYYRFFYLCSGMDIKNHTDYKLLDASVVKEYLLLNESSKFYRGLIHWLGFHSINFPINVIERPGNESSWGLVGLIKYAKRSVLSFSFLPLRTITWLGVLLFLFSLVLGVDTLLKTFNGNSAEGFPTVILLVLGIGSLILFSLGLIGEYLAEIYQEIKSRPKYIEAKRVVSANHDEKTGK